MDASERDALRRRAESIGLTRLTDAHLDQLESGTSAADRLRRAVPQDLHMYDEPALVFRCGDEA